MDRRRNQKEEIQLFESTSPRIPLTAYLPFLVAVPLIVLILQACSVLPDSWRNVFEENSVRDAAKEYLEAEVNRDYEKIYRSLAPSSSYRSTTGYDSYLAEAASSHMKIVSYRIVGISRIDSNLDAREFPNVEKIAQVDTDVVIRFENSNQQMEVNYGFIFIKEGGRWYKG
ncbi:MAG: nuclear transport factor 2 family protein [Syntrophales bacterium]|nr:nuclear transport factor 2 family protein [Syntrophales bacterium]MDD5233471.1 nuclear transport factor 2 family protein [Syntrophales bacterium]MDD5533025.1 nuclear transport factor 2 family protein [Syntrophales bacterium]